MSYSFLGFIEMWSVLFSLNHSFLAFLGEIWSKVRLGNEFIVIKLVLRCKGYGLVLWHINHCRLFTAKSSLYIYIKYIGFGWVGFYGIPTIVGYLMPNPPYTYILNIYDLVWLGWVLWHINHCRLFNAKSSLYIYIEYICL